MLVDRVLPIGASEVETWAHPRASSSRKLPAIDSLLAATAIRHDLVLATRNIKDFKDMPALQTYNPWEGSAE